METTLAEAIKEARKRIASEAEHGIRVFVSERGFVEMLVGDAEYFSETLEPGVTVIREIATQKIIGVRFQVDDPRMLVHSKSEVHVRGQ